MTNEHVCQYLELLPDGAYFCGGCQKTYRLTPEPRPSHIKTWRERCDELHGDMVIVSSSMVQQRIQEEIDDLRAALNRGAGTK